MGYAVMCRNCAPGNQEEDRRPKEVILARVGPGVEGERWERRPAKAERPELPARSTSCSEAGYRRCHGEDERAVFLSPEVSDGSLCTDT
jgi:hypothetical protein